MKAVYYTIHHVSARGGEAIRRHPSAALHGCVQTCRQPHGRARQCPWLGRTLSAKKSHSSKELKTFACPSEEHSGVCSGQAHFIGSCG